MNLKHQMETYMKQISNNLFILNIKGHNNIGANINTIDKNEIMIILTSNTGNYSDNPLTTNNNNNDNYNKSITIKLTKKSQERKK